MKYFKIDFTSIFDNKEEVLGHANGELVPNNKEYFDRISNDEIIISAPLFDFFYLQSFDPEKEWEWRLQDVHGGIGVYPRGNHWYISNKCKKIFEQFNIAQQYHFYATKLLYKGEKLDYWIFQNIINFTKSNIDFDKSVFKVLETNELIENKILDYESFSDVRRILRKESGKKIGLKKLVLFEEFDFLLNMIEGDKIVSERLKEAIEKAGLEGFEFSELEYEVSVE